MDVIDMTLQIFSVLLFLMKFYKTDVQSTFCHEGSLESILSGVSDIWGFIWLQYILFFLICSFHWESFTCIILVTYGVFTCHI